MPNNFKILNITVEIDFSYSVNFLKNNKFSCKYLLPEAIVDSKI